jgi:hypothetical protein
MRIINGIPNFEIADDENMSIIAGANVTETGQLLVAITGLTLPLAANSVYEFEALLSAGTTAVVTGTQYGIQFSAAGATIEAYAMGAVTIATSLMQRILALHTATAAFLTTASQNGGVLIKGFITTGANRGNLTIEHLKVTSGTSTVRIGSFLKTRKIS